MSSPRVAWISFGKTQTVLTDAMLSLFWEGVKDELIIATPFLNRMIVSSRGRNGGRVADDNEIDSDDDDDDDETLKSRISTRVAAAMEKWNLLDLDDEKMLECLQEALVSALEAQVMPQQLRYARMVLESIGLFDVDLIMEYREAPLASRKGDVQLETISGHSSPNCHDIIVVRCNDCRKPLRGAYMECTSGCEVSTADGGISARSNYRVCMSCFPNTDHHRRHLRKTEHKYVPSLSLQSQLDDEEFLRLRRRCQKVQRETDYAEDLREHGRVRANLFRAFPSFQKRLFPLGNVHSALMVGPLIIENGVKDSQHGVRISLRRLPRTFGHWGNIEPRTIIAVNEQRELFQASEVPKLRNIQASAKQVLGGLFSGHVAEWSGMEELIINGMATQAGRWEQRPLKSLLFHRQVLENTADNIILLLKLGFKKTLRNHLDKFAGRLFQKKIRLTWNQYWNNCQTLCEALVDRQSYGKLFVPLTSPSQGADVPLRYLVSFVGPLFPSQGDSSLLSYGPLSAFLKVPHREMDMIGFQEMQGRNSGPLDPVCAKIFAWPCQNASCGLADHAWNNPYEYCNVLQFHLTRDRQLYTQPDGSDVRPLTDDEWIQNRFNVLEAMDQFLSLAAGVLKSFEGRCENPSKWKPGPSELGRVAPLYMPEDYVIIQQEDSYVSPFRRIRGRGLLAKIIKVPKELRANRGEIRATCHPVVLHTTEGLRSS